MAEYTWSFSSLKDFLNCPKKYNEVKVLQNFTVIASEKMIYGTEVHKALEDYVRDGTELAVNYLKYKPAVDSLKAIPGTKYCEYEMALGHDKMPCDFHDEKRWVRGIVDLLIVDGEYAFIVDYKTGSDRFADTSQLKLMALMTFAFFPEVTKIKAGLLFVVNNRFITEEYKREDTEFYWNYFVGPLKRLTQAYDTNVWPANPTALCRFCPVQTCEFHRG